MEEYDGLLIPVRWPYETAKNTREIKSPQDHEEPIKDLRTLAGCIPTFAIFVVEGAFDGAPDGPAGSSGRAPLQTLVIDHIDRPSDN